MALTGTRVSVVTTAGGTIILAGSGADGGRARITNHGASVSVFLGGAGVTAALGYELKAGKDLDVELSSGETLLGITAAGTVVVHVLATRG